MNPLHRNKPATLATAKQLLQTVNKTANKGNTRLQDLVKAVKSPAV